MDFSFDQTALMDMAASKIADEIIGRYDGEIVEIVETRLTSVVDGLLTDEVRGGLSKKIDAALDEALRGVLEHEYVAVDAWGDPITGEKTSIRAQLANRAKLFFEEKVQEDRNNSGSYRVTSYGGEPRWQVMYKQLTQEALEAAIRENVTEVVAGFKAAMKETMSKELATQIEQLIPSRRR